MAGAGREFCPHHTAEGGAMGLQVVGLKQFSAKVRKAQQGTPRVMRSGLNVVGSIIVKQTLADFPGEMSTNPENVARRTGKLERSTRPFSTTVTGRVAVGSPKRVPYAGWWIFGGPQRQSNRPPNREYVSEGRVLFPSYDKVRPEVRAEMERMLQAIAAIITQ